MSSYDLSLELRRGVKLNQIVPAGPVGIRCVTKAHSSAHAMLGSKRRHMRFECVSHGCETNTDTCPYRLANVVWIALGAIPLIDTSRFLYRSGSNLFTMLRVLPSSLAIPTTSSCQSLTEHPRLRQCESSIS